MKLTSRWQFVDIPAVRCCKGQLRYNISNENPKWGDFRGFDSSITPFDIFAQHFARMRSYLPLPTKSLSYNNPSSYYRWILTFSEEAGDIANIQFMWPIESLTPPINGLYFFARIWSTALPGIKIHHDHPLRSISIGVVSPVYLISLTCGWSFAVSVVTWGKEGIWLFSLNCRADLLKTDEGWLSENSTSSRLRCYMERK